MLLVGSGVRLAQLTLSEALSALDHLIRRQGKEKEWWLDGLIVQAALGDVASDEARQMAELEAWMASMRAVPDAE